MPRIYKILFLASWYPTTEDPINGIFIERHAQSVSELCDVTVQSYHQVTIDKNDFEYSEKNGIKIMRIYHRKTSSKNILVNNRVSECLTFLIKNYKAYKLICKKDGKPDLIHLNVLHPMGLFAIFLHLIHNIPYIVTEHTSPFSIYYGSLIRKLGSILILKHARFILPVSASLKREMQDLYDPDKYVIIPNIVNKNFFIGNLKHQNLQEKKNIIHVSLLNDNQKNISGIIDAVYEVSKKRDDFRLQIVGDGVDRKELEDLAEIYNILGTIVIFSGRLSDEELLESYRNSCFFVLNSNHETFAIVCAEALACGIPVISTRCGGPEEYIDGKMGLLIEINNHDQLVAAILHMLDHYQDYDSTYLHDSIQSKFSSEIVGEKIFQVYNRVLKE